MEPNKYQELIDIIHMFESETGFDRKDFVMVVSPKCEVVQPDHTGKFPTTVDGVEIIQNELMHETALTMIPRHRLPDLADIIIDMGLAEEYDDEFDDEDIEPIEMVPCATCGHPISVFLSEDMETVTCPWCKQKSEIDE